VPRKVDWDERRAALAEAVWRAIQRHGIAHTSIRNIAEESGWTRGVLQRYFRDKDELMLFAFELACDHALEVNGRVVGDATGLEVVRRMLMSFVRPDEEQRLVTIVLTAFVARIPTHPELAEEFRRRWIEWLRVTEDIFSGLAAAGALRAGLDPGLTAVEYFSVASGLSQVEAIIPDLCELQQCERLVDDYLRKIGSPAELKRLNLEPLEPAAV
jgi:AcrR family transcriptional regulator